MIHKRSLLDLGEDVLVFHVLPHLHYDEIISLTQIKNHELRRYLNSSFFYQLLFRKQFGDNNATPLNPAISSWSQLYQLRLDAHLYTWGKNEQGRLGYRISEAPADNVNETFGTTNVTKPTEVKAFRMDRKYDGQQSLSKGKDVVLVDVSGGDYGFQVVSGNGNIYTSGYASSSGPAPRPITNDYNPILDLESLSNPFSVATSLMDPANDSLSEFFAGNQFATLGPENYYSPDALQELNSIKQQTNFIFPRCLPPTEYTKSLKIVAISSGKLHFLVVDSKNKVWSWESKSQVYGVRLMFIDSSTKSPIIKNPRRNVVTKIAAGVSFSAAYIVGVGIVLWNARDPVVKESGKDDAVSAHSRVLKNTGSLYGSIAQVVDFYVGDGFLIYITADGHLHRIDIPDEQAFMNLDSLRAYEILSFNHYLKTTSTGSKFVKITGNFHDFAVFTNNDNVAIGTKNNTSSSNFDFETGTFADVSKPMIFQELQGKNCIHVAIGDTHCLALFANGDIYSWGIEKKACGSLGLGSWEEIVSKYGHNAVEFNPNIYGTSLTVPRPLKLDLKDKIALAVAAVGSQSAAILAKKPI